MADLRVSEDIVPLSDFKARASEWLKRVAKTGSPVVITQNGRAAAVLMSPSAFDELTERNRFVDAVADGLADLEAGRVVNQDSVVAEMTARFGSPDE